MTIWEKSGKQANLGSAVFAPATARTSWLRRLFVSVIVSALWLSVPALAQTVHSATVTWTAPANPPVGITYTVYKATINLPTAIYTVLQAGITTLTFTDTPLPAGTVACYRITATAPQMSESAPTTSACGSTPADITPTPGAPKVMYQ